MSLHWEKKPNMQDLNGRPTNPVDLYLIFEKSSSTNWIFSLFLTEFLLPVLPAKINLKI